MLKCISKTLTKESSENFVDVFAFMECLPKFVFHYTWLLSPEA